MNNKIKTTKKEMANREYCNHIEDCKNVIKFNAPNLYKIFSFKRKLK